MCAISGRGTVTEPLEPGRKPPKCQISRRNVGHRHFHSLGLRHAPFCLSPKDAALGGPGAHDPIEERTLRDGGFEARDRWIGVAVELVESPAGFALATRASMRDVGVPRVATGSRPRPAEPLS
jgi:hypothetical protein